MKLFAVAALAALAFAPVAQAADAHLNDCVQKAKQVYAALETAQPGSSTDEARQLATAGRSFCSSQMYTQGVARYTKALQLLGKN